MIKCKKLETLKEIEDNYNVFFIDLWGVIHNGIELFEFVSSSLMRLKDKKKKIIFITNAPRRALVISQQLQQFGLSKNNYDYIVSSGEITWISLKKTTKKKNVF